MAEGKARQGFVHLRNFSENAYHIPVTTKFTIAVEKNNWRMILSCINKYERYYGPGRRPLTYLLYYMACLR